MCVSCSVESSEIDLSEFEEENRDDGDGGEDGNNGAGQSDAQPNEGAAAPASGNDSAFYHLHHSETVVGKRV